MIRPYIFYLSDYCEYSLCSLNPLYHKQIKGLEKEIILFDNPWVHLDPAI